LLTMEVSKFAFRTANREIIAGSAPLVVGTLSSLSEDLEGPQFRGSCDIVEVRLDCAGQAADWLERCCHIEALGWPVLLTLRSSEEGGQWIGDGNRKEVLERGLRSLSAIDIEMKSILAPGLAKLAGDLGKVCIVSHHNFENTPPLEDLETIVSKAQDFGAIVKVSTRICGASDVETLRSLLGKKRACPLCVIGMGAEWKDTRVSFAQIGSCLTYGYLDKSAAPGQIPARELMKQLKTG
jgi:3-dehydroquinate dehydratase I